MKPGDTLATALWYNPEREHEYARAREGVEEGLRLTAESEGFLLGPVAYESVGPEDPRLPAPPKHMRHSVKALIGEAEVLCRKPVFRLEERRFVGELERRDLERLRAITRRRHAERFPGADPLSDDACDDIIEEIGPEAAFDALRKAVDAGAA